MKHTIKFKLPDDGYELKQAFFANEAFSLLDHVSETIRLYGKHGLSSEFADVDAMLQHFRREIEVLKEKIE
jgi:hypothetical protein